MSLSDFLSVLRALHNVEPWALAEVCPGIDEDAQHRMAKDPVRFLMRADAERGDALWRLMQPLTRVELDVAEPVETRNAA